MWRSCRIYLNGIFGGYKTELAVVAQHERATIPLTEFTKGDGKRFNSYTHKIDSIHINCMHAPDTSKAISFEPR